jgi:hypothetical protein
MYRYFFNKNHGREGGRAFCGEDLEVSTAVPVPSNSPALFWKCSIEIFILFKLVNAVFVKELLKLNCIIVVFRKLKKNASTQAVGQYGEPLHQ